MRAPKSIVAIAGSLIALAVLAKPQEKEATDAEYTAQALSAAPKGVAAGAVVVRMERDGSMRTLHTNGFTCMVMGTEKMSNDAAWDLFTR
jgi:hypothetical protein